MTSQELKQRIAVIGTMSGVGHKREIYRLIRDCIEAVTPTKPDLDPNDTPYVSRGFLVGEMHGRYDAIDIIQANTKELLG